MLNGLHHEIQMTTYGRVRFDVPWFWPGEIDFRRCWSRPAKVNILADPFATWAEPFAK